MMAFLRSCSPPSIFLVSPASTCAERSSSARPRSSATGSPASPHSTSTVEVLEPLAQRFAEIAILFEAAPALQQLLRRRLVLPEVRGTDALFDGLQLVGGMCCVKGSSAGRRRGAPDPDTCEAVRPTGMPRPKLELLCGFRLQPEGDGCRNSESLHAAFRLTGAEATRRRASSGIAELYRTRAEARSAATVKASDAHATTSPKRV